MINFECPNCHSHKWIDHGTASTLAYYPPIYENGININPDKNIHKTIAECGECHRIWEIRQRYGEEDQIEEVIQK